MLCPYMTKRMLWAAVSLAFFGYLPIDEITCSNPLSPSIYLKKSDMKGEPNNSNFSGHGLELELPQQLLLAVYLREWYKQSADDLLITIWDTSVPRSVFW